MIEDFVSKVNPALYERSGAVFYSGRSAFSVPSDIYILGLNPGGNSEKQAVDTVRRNIEGTLSGPPDWSAYRDESWEDKEPGTYGMQPRVLHLLSGLKRDPDKVPSSNVVFVRSPREKDLTDNKGGLLRACWPFHDAVIQHLGVRVVLCFGGTAGSWVRKALGAQTKIGAFTERNDRRWTSEAHQAPDGRAVVTLTHPSIAKWDAPETDPTALVRAVVENLGPASNRI